MNIKGTTKDFPTTWTNSLIGDVAEFVRGVTYQKSDARNQAEEGYIPLIRATNIGNESITYDEFVFVPRNVVKSEQLIRVNDMILAASSGSISVVGKSAPVLKDFEATFGAFCAVLRPKNEVLPGFFRLFVQSPTVRETWSNLARGTNINNLKREQVLSTGMPIAPLLEQQKIVEILEEQLSRLDAALAAVHAVREKSARFRRSLLHAAFTGALTGHDTSDGTFPEGWNKRLLKECLEKLKSGKYVERGWSPQCLSHPAENSWGVLKTTSVQMGNYLPEYNKELPKTLEPKIGLEVNDGDFLVTTTGPRNRCGVVCHVKTTPKKLIFSGKILRFRADENLVLAPWVMYLLMSPDYQKVLDQLKVGTSDSSVSIGNQQILDLDIPVASIDEQKRIVEILEEQFSRMDAALAVADVIEKKASALRRSLLHAAFNGNLTKEWREGAHV